LALPINNFASDETGNQAKNNPADNTHASALVGGFLFDLFGASGITGLNIYSMIVAIAGSTVVLLIYNTLMGSRRA